MEELVAAKIHGVPSGREHTPLPGCCCLPSALQKGLCEFLRTGDWVLPAAAYLSAGVMVPVWYGGVCIQERQRQAAMTPACTQAGRGRRCWSLSSSLALWLLDYSALLGQEQHPGPPAPTPGTGCRQAHARWAAARAGGDRKGPFSPRPVAAGSRFGSPCFLPSQASRRSSSWTPRET